VEVGGEAAGLNALIPYNVNASGVRQRFWDGQDKLLRDDLTILKGNHLLGFGGAYQRNFDYFSRTDNGNGVNDQIVYQITSTGINFTNSPYIPATVPSSQLSNYESLYAEVLGIVSQPQVVYARSGPQLNLQPVGTPATERAVIPYYSVYSYDAWHVKPSFTVTYGLGWNLEMPPYEIHGSQVELVDANGNLIDANDFIAQREKAALAGTTYTPEIGFELVRNVGSGLKYPYNPYYGEFSPRASFAWNPRFSGGILGKVFGDGKERAPRRLGPHLRPPQRSRLGACAAARARSAARRYLPRRVLERPVPRRGQRGPYQRVPHRRGWSRSSAAGGQPNAAPAFLPGRGNQPGGRRPDRDRSQLPA
jgi:hypothetical protein